jgi:hypothetical protein
MDVSLVVGPERAGNANVSRAIDRSQIRAQEDEPLADRPIYLGVKLQVVACVVAVGILARIIREALAGGVLVGEVGAKVPLAVP